MTGIFFAPTPCYELSASSSLSGSTLGVNIIARSTLGPGSGCAEVIQPFSYTATVRGVKPGAVDVVVTHAVSGSAGTVVLNQTVTVP